MPVCRSHRSPKCKFPLSVSSRTSKEAALQPGKWFWISAQLEIYWGDRDRIKKDRMQRCSKSHGGISWCGCPGKLALGSLRARVRELLALGLCDSLEARECCSWGPLRHRTRPLLAPAAPWPSMLGDGAHGDSELQEHWAGWRRSEGLPGKQGLGSNGTRGAVRVAHKQIFNEITQKTSAGPREAAEVFMPDWRGPSAA